MRKLFLILTVLCLSYSANAQMSYKEYFETDSKVLILAFVYDIKPEIVSENQNYYVTDLCKELTKLGYKANKDNWFDIQLNIDEKTGTVLKCNYKILNNNQEKTTFHYDN